MCVMCVFVCVGEEWKDETKGKKAILLWGLKKTMAVETARRKLLAQDVLPQSTNDPMAACRKEKFYSHCSWWAYITKVPTWNFDCIFP